GRLASFYNGRNLIRLLAKDLPAGLVPRMLPAILRYQARRARSALSAWRGEAARATLRGQLCGLAGLPQHLADRPAIQSRRRVSALRVRRPGRRGKGRAVRTGMLAAEGAVVIFADADLSWEVQDLSRFVALVDERTPIVIGSREGVGARRVGEPIYRHLMGRVFNRVVQALAVPGLEDSQCGFKSLRREAAQAIFERQHIDGFGFDVEVLYLARRLGF